MAKDDRHVGGANAVGGLDEIALLEREEIGPHDELMARNQANLDIFWLRDESLEETENLPDPDIIAGEIVEDLEAALEQFRLIAEDLGNSDG